MQWSVARLGRYFIPGQPQHVIQRGNNREPIFVSEQDYGFYKDCLLEACQRYQLAVHAYVLMTNHVHLLATPGQEETLPKVFQSVGRKYVQYFNYTYQRTGTLWEGRYKATLIDTARYLFVCMRYIELNPVRANMVEHPGAYPYSSYCANAQGRVDQLVVEHSLYRQLGHSNRERQESYRALFKAAIAETEIENIREATNKGWVLGNEYFREKIEKLSGRRAAPKKAGRPKKN